jgi:hypothetical protein
MVNFLQRAEMCIQHSKNLIRIYLKLLKCILAISIKESPPALASIPPEESRKPKVTYLFIAATSLWMLKRSVLRKSTTLILPPKNNNSPYPILSKSQPPAVKDS